MAGGREGLAVVRGIEVVVVVLAEMMSVRAGGVAGSGGGDDGSGGDSDKVVGDRRQG